MKSKLLFLVVAMAAAVPSAFSQDPDPSVNFWRILTDSKYRAARIKQNQDITLRFIPIQGRLAACGLAQEIVASPLEWQDNARRIADIPVVLRIFSLEFTDDFAAFQVSATALIEFSAQLQSTTREQVSQQLASERSRASQHIGIEASLKTNIVAKYSAIIDSEKQLSAEITSIDKRDFPALSAEQATIFRRLYAQLLSDYAAVTKRLPTITEMLELQRPKK
jgi:hypothetical protein